MARHTQVILIDDLDGSEATETINFGLDGTTYEIDLSEDNAKRLREALSPFVSNARRAEPTPTRGRRRGAGQRAMSREKSAEIRAWARENGWDVPERGRVSAEVREAFLAAR